VSYGRVKRGWLGVSVRGITPEMARAYGVEGTNGAMINDVFKGDPADRAGIKRGDVVVEINGQKVKDANDFVAKVRTLAPNSTAKLQIVRKGRKMTFNVKLAERNSKGDGSVENSSKEDDRSASRSSGIDALKDFGIARVAPLTESLRRQYKINSGSDGLIILEIDRNSQASSDGDIREGDLIIEINGYEVKSASDVSKALGNDTSVVLMLEREGSTYFTMVSKAD
ncbi:MAG: PDZ domain-containing protein, partial [Synergistaceae bacterium]|nr:PDZ domain-containing protein [Synergistaceae bacterium]